MDEKVKAFLESAVKKGKLTQAEADAKIAKHDKKEAAKKNFKANGKSMKKDELIAEVSDLDDIVAFTKAGIMKVVKVSDKVFIGKDIIHQDSVFQMHSCRPTTTSLIIHNRKDGRIPKVLISRDSLLLLFHFLSICRPNASHVLE